MDHLLAALFSVIFAHPAAHATAATPQPSEFRTFASHYSVAAIASYHLALPYGVNRHPASYAVARVGQIR